MFGSNAQQEAFNGIYDILDKATFVPLHFIIYIVLKLGTMLLVLFLTKLNVIDVGWFL